MTSNPYRIRLPARRGLDVRESGQRQIAGEIADRLLDHCGCTGHVSRFSGDPDELQGYYRIDAGMRHLLLKVMPESYLEQQLEADRFSVFVQKSGIKSSVIIPGYPRQLGGGLITIAYDWIEGRFLQSSPLELEQFGNELGQLHKVLARYPHQEVVRSRTRARLLQLAGVAERISELDRLESPYLLRLYGLLQENPGLFDPFEEPCQVLHGDLNVGNILWTGSNAVFLDFEDSKHSWFPTRIEVAFVLERLALFNEPDDYRAAENAKALLRGYVNSFGQTPFSYAGAFEGSLEWLSARSLCMLQHFEWDGMAWPESEWLKFNDLLDHMERRSEMIFEIESSFFD